MRIEKINGHLANPAFSNNTQKEKFSEKNVVDKSGLLLGSLALLAIGVGTYFFNKNKKTFDTIVTQNQSTLNNQTVSDNLSKVKDKLSELSSDKDWIYLRKLRKSINKKIEKTQEDYAKKELIDEILYSKANGITTNYLKHLGINIDDAVKLIKSKSTNEEVDLLINAIKVDSTQELDKKLMDTVNLPYYKLTLKSLFPELL